MTPLNSESIVPCKICGEERKLKELKKHIWGKHRMTGKQYLDKYPELQEPVMPISEPIQEEKLIMEQPKRIILPPESPKEEPAPVQKAPPPKPMPTLELKVPLQEVFIDHAEIPLLRAYYRDSEGRYYQRDLVGHGRFIMDDDKGIKRLHPVYLVTMDDGRIVPPFVLEGFVGVFPEDQEFQETPTLHSQDIQNIPEFTTEIGEG